SINPLRTTTVPLAMVGPLTVTILALRMATGGWVWVWAIADAPNRSSVVTIVFIQTVRLAFEALALLNWLLFQFLRRVFSILTKRSQFWDWVSTLAGCR